MAVLGNIGRGTSDGIMFKNNGSLVENYDLNSFPDPYINEDQ